MTVDMAKLFLRSPDAFEVPDQHFLDSVLVEDLYVVKRVRMPNFILEQELPILEDDQGT
jgi:hypothetical protein